MLTPEIKNGIGILAENAPPPLRSAFNLLMQEITLLEACKDALTWAVGREYVKEEDELPLKNWANNTIESETTWVSAGSDGLNSSANGSETVGPS